MRRATFLSVPFAILVAWLVMGAAFAGSSPDKAPPSTQAAEWKLPAKVRLDPPRFRVTGDHRCAIYADEELSQSQSAGQDLPPPVTYWVLRRGAEPSKIIDLLPEEARKAGLAIRFVEPSPKGSVILVLGRTADGSMSAYVLDLEKNRSERIGSSPRIVPMWAGTEIVVAEADKDQIRPLSVVVPFQNKSRALPLHGMIIAGSANAGTFVLLGDPADLRKQMARADFAEKARLVSAAADGKVLRDLAAAQSLNHTPVLSPGGKYVAFQQRSEKPQGKPSIRVLSVAGSEDRAIREFALVLSVSDSGEVVTFGVGDTSDGTPIKAWDAKGTPRVLVKAAQAATVSGGQVFYVTPGEAPVIKSVSIPN